MQPDRPETTRIRVIGEALREADKETATLRAALQDRKSPPDATTKYRTCPRCLSIMLVTQDCTCDAEGVGNVE